MNRTSEERIVDFLRSHNPFEKGSSLKEGEKVGDWRILAFLGRGGSAEVYRAKNEVSGIVGAVKIQSSMDARVRERFKREIKLLAKVRSSAFPKFYGAGDFDGGLYIAEEMLEPVTLPKGDFATARFLIEIAGGVTELHSLGFVHRDIKPGNIMVRPLTGEYVLVDMGLAKEFAEVSPAEVGTLSVVDGHLAGVGTPGYSAPEQFTGGKLCEAADIHALGILANSCFENKPPAAWKEIIRRSTSSLPEQRYQNVNGFVCAVRRRHNGRLALAVIPLVTALAFFVVFFGRKNALKDSPRIPDSGINIAADALPEVKNLKKEILPAAKFFDVGKTTAENGVLVTRIDLNGRNVMITGDVNFKGKRRIEIDGGGRITAAITGTEDVSLVLRGNAELVNLTTIDYPLSKMRYILRGACYLNFKNLDPPAGNDFKNIWDDSFNGKGTPFFTFRGPDSRREAESRSVKPSWSEKKRK